MIEFSVGLQKNIFPFLAAEEARVLLEVMGEVSCAAGTVLFNKSEPADTVYFLVAGKVAVQKSTGFGDRTQVVALLDAGAPVGEGGIVGEQHRGSTVIAVKDSQLLSLSCSAFEKISSEFPGIANRLLRWLLSRVSLRLKKNSDRLAYIL